MPIIFDAPMQLGNELKMATVICTNGSGPNWGGCEVWISRDDESFRYAGTLRGGTTMGTLTGSFGALSVSTTLAAQQNPGDTTLSLSSGTNFFSGAAVQIDGELEKIGTLSGSSGTGVIREFDNTPSQTHSVGATVTLLSDDANTLAVDLTQSQGTLLAGSVTDADDYTTLCVVDSELVAYSVMALTSQYKYSAGPSNGSYIRRGVFGTGSPAHSSGAPFARLRPNTYVALPYKNNDVGKTVFVKLLSFNLHGGGKQTLDQVSSTSHVLSPPPASALGLLPGVIQTTDLVGEAATGQTTASNAFTTSSSFGSNVLVTSASRTTVGDLVQISMDGIVGVPSGTINGGTSQSILTRDGVQIESRSVFIGGVPIQATPFMAFMTDEPPPGAHTYNLYLNIVLASGSPSNWSAFGVDLNLTEIKR